MSSTTTLQHECGGSVVIDVSPDVRLQSPSFIIKPGGITYLLLDIYAPENGKSHFTLQCKGCGQCLHQDKPEELKTISCHCVVCGNLTAVVDCFVYPSLAPVCKTCKDIMESARKSTLTPLSDPEAKVVPFLETFNIHSSPKPLLQVLSLPAVL